MPVHALKSNFGKVARGVALALAMTGGAMAQEATAPAAPAQPGASGPQATEQQAGLPQGCLPFNDLNRNVGKATGFLKQFAEGLQSYSGYAALSRKLADKGIKIDGVCAAVYPPQNDNGAPVRLNRQDGYTSLNLNITAKKDMGNNMIAIIPAPPEMVAKLIWPIYLPGAITSLSSLSAPADLTGKADNMDTAVLLKSAVIGNAMAEKILFAVERFTNAQSDDVLQALLQAPEMAAFKDDINDLWMKGATHLMTQTTLTDQEKNDFRAAIVAKVIRNRDLRTGLYAASEQEIVSGVMHGVLDPATDFKAQPDAAELANRLNKINPGLGAIDLNAISAELKAAPGDPSVNANKALNTILERIEQMKNRRAHPTGQAPAPQR